MLVAFIAVDIILGKIAMRSSCFESSFNLINCHIYSEPIQGELRHSDVTRNLFEADTTLPQSTKHLHENRRIKVD